MIKPPTNILSPSDDAFKRFVLKSGVTAELPPYVRVDFAGTREGRDYFMIREGHHKGLDGSITTAGGPHLVDPQGHQGPALVQFLPGKKKLRVANGAVPVVSAFVLAERRLSDGLHRLFIPNRAHDYSEGYAQAGVYRKTWFGIDKSDGPNYFHPGQHSAGCLAMTDIAQWPSIASHLVRCRDDDQTVGSLQVCRPTADDWCLFFNNRYKIRMGNENTVTLTFRPVSDVCLAVEGTSVDPSWRFRLNAVLPIRDGNLCQTYIPETPCGGVMQGTWSELSGDARHSGHVRIGVIEVGGLNPNLHAMVRVAIRGTISRGPWGRPGTTKEDVYFESVDGRERPWYNYPWNPGYPWNAQPA